MRVDFYGKILWDGGVKLYLDLISSFFVALILFLLIEKKFKGKERF